MFMPLRNVRALNTKWNSGLPASWDKQRSEGVSKMLADELMEEVVEQIRGRDGDIERFCKLFDPTEIDIVIARLEDILQLHISKYGRDVRFETARAMIERLKSVRVIHPGLPAGTDRANNRGE